MTPQKMNPREKMGVVLLVIALAVFGYLRLVVRPADAKIRGYLQSMKKAEKQIKELRRKDPVITQQQSRMQGYRKEIADLQAEIGTIESSIPSITEAQNLIRELTKAIPGERLLSLRQKLVPEEPYFRIYYEIIVVVTYPEALEMIWKIESLSPFLVVEEMLMEDPKDKKKPEENVQGVPMKLVVSCLLQSGEGGEEFLDAAKKSKDFEPVKRDILISQTRASDKKKERKKIGLKLEGVTYNGPQSVVILSGNVYRLGAEVDGFKIKEILQNAVVLADDTGEYRIDISGGDAVRVDEGSTS